MELRDTKRHSGVHVECRCFETYTKSYSPPMQRLQAFKFELMPTGEQARKMCRFGGLCRRVYNDALDAQQKNRDEGGKFVGYVGMAKWLTAWRNDPARVWMRDAPVTSSGSRSISAGWPARSRARRTGRRARRAFSASTHVSQTCARTLCTRHGQRSAKTTLRSPNSTQDDFDAAAIEGHAAGPEQSIQYRVLGPLLVALHSASKTAL
jgi:Helix-turn-helix domain